MCLAYASSHNSYQAAAAAGGGGLGLGTSSLQMNTIPTSFSQVISTQTGKLINSGSMHGGMHGGMMGGMNRGFAGNGFSGVSGGVGVGMDVGMGEGEGHSSSGLSMMHSIDGPVLTLGNGELLTAISVLLYYLL